MASYTATVSDGVLLDNGTEYSALSTTSSTSSSGSSTLEYEQFLQLLCTEMQYQDPLEPATNTEYVAQLATFSQLEATLSLENTLYQQTANDLVGKTVIMRVENSTTGAVSYVDGNVDYVMYEDGETYLSVNDSLYPLSDLDTVADTNYYEALGLAKSLENMLDQMPDVDNITVDYETLITQITDLYDGMTSYQQNYVSDYIVAEVEAYRSKLAEVKEEAEGIATAQADSLSSKLAELPDLTDVTVDDEDAINEILDQYDGMTTYTQNLLDEDLVSQIEAYRDRLAEILAEAEEEEDVDDVTAEEEVGEETADID